MNYYDSLLLLIPSLMIVGGGVSLLTGLSLQTAIICGAVLSVAAVGHGMFINPPVDPSVVLPNSSPQDSTGTEDSALNSSAVSDD